MEVPIVGGRGAMSVVGGVSVTVSASGALRITRRDTTDWPTRMSMLSWRTSANPDSVAVTR
jgi:hypothetical protein